MVVRSGTRRRADSKRAKNGWNRTCAPCTPTGAKCNGNSWPPFSGAAEREKGGGGAHISSSPQQNGLRLGYGHGVRSGWVGGQERSKLRTTRKPSLQGKGSKALQDLEIVPEIAVFLTPVTDTAAAPMNSLGVCMCEGCKSKVPSGLHNAPVAENRRCHAGR